MALGRAQGSCQYFCGTLRFLWGKKVGARLVTFAQPADWRNDLLCRDLESLFTINFYLLYDSQLRKFCQQLIKGLFVGGSEVSNDFAVGFNLVWGFSEVGDEVQDINLSHRFEMRTEQHIRHQIPKCFGR